ncbi:MAG: DUF1778 domain-containing protein [Labrys sp. (in: a-proteobacteria)]|jgi:uncharacterized protein (DUF1778 family)
MERSKRVSKPLSKDLRLNLRIPSAARTLIVEAAQAKQQAISVFMLEQTLAAAERTLTDRSVFILNEADWTALEARLDAPPRDLPKLAAARKKRVRTAPDP